MRAGLGPSARLTTVGGQAAVAVAVLGSKGAVMEKWLCKASLIIAGLLLLAFLLDLIFKVPFGGPPTFLTIDIVGVIASGLLAYLAWDALKDLL